MKEAYRKMKDPIRQRLKDFRNVPAEEYFYELCYCICTPQSKALNALEVQKKLMKARFLEQPLDPVPLLRDPTHYIRFHNQKAARLLAARNQFPAVEIMLQTAASPEEKRMWLVENLKGFGMKESSHFLRNIGYRGLAILDRHILKHLIGCGLYKEIPKVTSIKSYLSVEEDFRYFAERTGIPMDELDLLFWSAETGEVLK